MIWQTWEEVAEKLDGLDYDHCVAYYLPAMTLEQWIKLDQMMSEALGNVLGDEEFFCVAGPIPETGDV